jgi:hypothetical protein
MARHKKPDHEKFQQVPAAVLPATVEALQQIAIDREWSLSQAVRKAIEKGLEVMLPASTHNRTARTPRDKATV